MEGIIDTGGSKALMPLKVAMHNFRNLVVPIRHIKKVSLYVDIRKIQTICFSCKKKI